MNKSYSVSDLVSLYYENEFACIEEIPVPGFSLRHKSSMKRTFRKFKKNSQNLYLNSYNIPARRKNRLNRRTIILTIVLAFLALISGCAVAQFLSGNFRGEVYHDNTELFVVDASNSPEFIEYKYNLTEIPEGFSPITEEWFSTPFMVYYLYEKENTRDHIILSQSTKADFGSIHLNTEKGELTDITVNGHNGVCLSIIEDNDNYACIIWDNGDYILEISANMEKEKVLALAEKVEIEK